MRSQRHHQEYLTEHGENGESSPVSPTVCVKFVVLQNTSADVARIEKVSSCSIRYENTHDTGITPVVAFRNLKYSYLGGEGPQ